MGAPLHLFPHFMDCPRACGLLCLFGSRHPPSHFTLLLCYSWPSHRYRTLGLVVSVGQPTVSLGLLALCYGAACVVGSLAIFPCWAFLSRLTGISLVFGLIHTSGSSGSRCFWLDLLHTWPWHLACLLVAVHGPLAILPWASFLPHPLIQMFWPSRRCPFLGGIFVLFGCTLHHACHGLYIVSA